TPASKRARKRSASTGAAGAVDQAQKESRDRAMDQLKATATVSTISNDTTTAPIYNETDDFLKQVQNERNSWRGQVMLPATYTTTWNSYSNAGISTLYTTTFNPATTTTTTTMCNPYAENITATSAMNTIELLNDGNWSTASSAS